MRRRRLRQRFTAGTFGSLQASRGEGSRRVSLQSWLGRLLRPAPAGERRLLQNDPRLGGQSAFSLSSLDFVGGGAMPRRCAGAGVGNVSPSLQWSGVPAAAAELAFVVQDPDAPLPWPVTRPIAFGLDPGAGAPPRAHSRREAAANSISAASVIRAPRPVASHGPHRYVFQIFAVAKPLRFGAPPDLAAIAAAMAGSVLGRARLTGRYERP